MLESTTLPHRSTARVEGAAEGDVVMQIESIGTPHWISTNVCSGALPFVTRILYSNPSYITLPSWWVTHRCPNLRWLSLELEIGRRPRIGWDHGIFRDPKLEGDMLVRRESTLSHDRCLLPKDDEPEHHSPRFFTVSIYVLLHHKYFWITIHSLVGKGNHQIVPVKA